MNARLLGYRIVSFDDAGFASLEGEHSIEANAIISGRSLFREGVIRCHGYLLGHRCAKIQRVCISSLSAEFHAAVKAGNYSLLYQILSNEIFTHVRQIRQLCPPADYPMLDPFAESPSGASLKADKLFLSESEKHWGPVTKLVGEPAQWNRQKCESCLVSIPVCTVERNYPIARAPPKSDSPMFKPLLRTDCCSLFSSIRRMQPNANERCSRIILAHLGDFQELIAISFVGASVNIGDAGAKRGGNNASLYEFLSTGRCTISSVGRKELMNQKKR